MNTLMFGVAAAALMTIAPAHAQVAPKFGAPVKTTTVTRAQISARIAAQFAKLDLNHDGFITKAEVASLEAAQSARNDASRPDMFANLDANHDGKVTKAEANAAVAARAAAIAKAKPGATLRTPNTDQMFARLDTNHDGVITKAELDAVRGQMEARRQGAMADRMFAMSDTNHDGRISLQESTAAGLKRFDSADVNHDGILTADEALKARQAMVAQRKPN